MSALLLVHSVVVGHGQIGATGLPPDQRSPVPLGQCPLAFRATALERLLSLPRLHPRWPNSEEKQNKERMLRILIKIGMRIMIVNEIIRDVLGILNRVCYSLLRGRLTMRKK